MNRRLVCALVILLIAVPRVAAAEDPINIAPLAVGGGTTDMTAIQQNQIDGVTTTACNTSAGSTPIVYNRAFAGTWLVSEIRYCLGKQSSGTGYVRTGLSLDGDSYTYTDWTTVPYPTSYYTWFTIPIEPVLCRYARIEFWNGGAGANTTISCFEWQIWGVEMAGLVVSAISTAAGVTVVWTEGAPPYTVYRDDVPIATVNDTSYLDDDAPWGQEVGYRVVDDEGAVGAAWVLTVPAAPVVTVQDVTVSTVRLSWTQVPTAGWYAVYRDGVLLGTTTEPDRQWYDRNLAPDYTFRYEVGARNGTGEGPRTQVIVTTDPQPPPPQAPQNLRLLSRTATSVTVAWDPVQGVAGYRVYLDGGLANITSAATINLGGLTPGNTYTVTVQAYTGMYDGDISDPLVVSTIGPPGQIQIAQIIPGAVTVYLSWVPGPGDAPTGYRVYVDGDLHGGTANTSYTVTGLNPGTTYTLAVAAVNDAGEGEPAAVEVTTTAMTVPDPVTGLRGNATIRTITVQWDLMDGAVRYVVMCDGDAVADVTRTSYRIDHLLPGTSYEIAVAAVNEAGMGAPASTQVVTLDGSPTILKVTPLGTGYVVTWDGPGDLDAPDCYEVYADGQLRHTSPHPSQWPDDDMGWTTASVHTIRIDAVYGPLICSDSKQITAYVAADPVDYPPPTSIFENILQDWSSLILLVVAFSVIWTIWDWWRGLFTRDSM